MEIKGYSTFPRTPRTPPSDSLKSYPGHKFYGLKMVLTSKLCNLALKKIMALKAHLVANTVGPTFKRQVLQRREGYCRSKYARPPQKKNCLRSKLSES